MLPSFASRRPGVHRVERVIHMALATAALSMSSCVTTAELVAEGRFGDACRRWELDEYAMIGDAIHDHVAPRVHVRVVSPEELSRMLPMVPSRMASGELVLVGLRAEVDHPFETARLSVRPRVEGLTGPFGCCDAETWGVLNGREPPSVWETLFAPARFIGEIGLTYAGTWVDVFWLITRGEIDIDLGEYSLRGRVRSLMDGAASSEEPPETTAPDPNVEPRAAGMLQALLEPPGDPPLGLSCDFSTETQCTRWVLYRLEPGRPPIGDLLVTFESQPQGCLAFREHWSAPLAPSAPTLGAALEGLFRETSLPVGVEGGMERIE